MTAPVLRRASEGVADPFHRPCYPLHNVLGHDRNILLHGHVGGAQAANLFGAVSEHLVELGIGVAELALFNNGDPDQGLAHQAVELRL